MEDAETYDGEDIWSLVCDVVDLFLAVVRSLGESGDHVFRNTLQFIKREGNDTLLDRT